MIYYLYIKQHSITGLKYFGKTIKKNPFKYIGSGKYWILHINKHERKYVKTIEIFGFDNQDLCTEFALKFSKDNNIVESDEWANLKEENGLDGGSVFGKNNPNFGKRRTEQQKINISKSLIGRTQTEEHKKHFIERIKINHPIRGKFGKNNPNFGTKRTEETKRKMSKSQSGEKHCQYGKRGKDSHNFGTKRTEETKRKISKKKIGFHRYYNENYESFKFFKSGEEPYGWYRKYI